MSLTGKQRRFLRARGHGLEAVAQIGKEGLSPAFVRAVDQALDDHELIKVRVGQNALVDRKQAAAELATLTTSEVAQILGNTFLLYRAHPEDPQLKLPAGREADA
jgi:RNA-binding protein